MRVFCLEDNALVVMHLESIIEDCGEEMVGSAASFDDAKSQWETCDFDLALIDIDLKDGVTGIDAARYVRKLGRLGCFVTGQEALAQANSELVIAVLPKPLEQDSLRGVFSAAKARLNAL